MKTKILLGVATVAVVAATGAVYCGGDVSEPQTTTTTSGSPNVVDSPAVASTGEPAAQAVADAGPHLYQLPPPAPYLETPTLPTGPAPVCTTCPKPATKPAPTAVH
ncbi:MAG: hypothetical protein U0235_18965 [Polyangiaceae bacterium]